MRITMQGPVQRDWAHAPSAPQCGSGTRICPVNDPAPLARRVQLSGA